MFIFSFSLIILVIYKPLEGRKKKKKEKKKTLKLPQVCSEQPIAHLQPRYQQQGQLGIPTIKLERNSEEKHDLVQKPFRTI